MGFIWAGGGTGLLHIFLAYCSVRIAMYINAKVARKLTVHTKVFKIHLQRFLPNKQVKKDVCTQRRVKSIKLIIILGNKLQIQRIFVIKGFLN